MPDSAPSMSHFWSQKLQLLLVRHGNTFEKGQPVLRVGAKTDLPLTERGREQAADCGNSIKQSGLKIPRIISGPLIRHRQHSDIIASKIGLDPSQIEVDERLQEIDYGAWEGKTDDEIRSMGFADELDAYNQSGIWPSGGIWGETGSGFVARIEEFTKHLTGSGSTVPSILVVTSGGVLRVVHELVSRGMEGTTVGNSKVATGHVSSLTFENGRWFMNFWNQDPRAEIEF